MENAKCSAMRSTSDSPPTVRAIYYATLSYGVMIGGLLPFSTLGETCYRHMLKEDGGVLKKDGTNER